MSFGWKNGKPPAPDNIMDIRSMRTISLAEKVITRYKSFEGISQETLSKVFTPVPIVANVIRKYTIKGVINL